jgi:hypothetical protein
VDGFKKCVGSSGMDRINLALIGTSEGPPEHGSVKCWEVLEWLS